MRPRLARGRRAGVLAACVLTVTSTIASCGGGTQDYCSSLADDQDQLTALAKRAGGKGTSLEQTLPLLEDLADQAPSDLTDEWQTLLSALHALRDALDRAGVDSSAVSSPKALSGVPPEQRKAITDAAGDLVSAQVVGAGDNIEQQARDVCHVDLSL